ncbi:pyrroline-5-carboxylate reductase [Sphingosinicella terrae]|uniref:pyrroline-5-carboxylate reductase n=1 Tax=Sphingosinicella terrae TaxID=2172047 RepID=UPI000E0DBEC0|nr:pyrroline-5-carboxylate reductase [Sphingosinicella terrae]
MASDPLLPGPLWFVGCGHMGSAMLQGWLASGVEPRHVTIIRPSGRPVADGVRVLTDYPEDEVPAIVLLAMKPHQLDLVAAPLASALDAATMLVSILAGVELASLRRRFTAPRTLVRAMPNLPVSLGRGVVGLFGETADLTARAELMGLMAALGHAEWFEDEQAFDLVTALAGSGPAFVYRFIEALAEGAASLGMPAEQAHRLAIATAGGAAALAAHEGVGLAELAARVTSPGGTTQAGLEVLDADDALAALVADTLRAARRRGQELAAAARRS